MTKFKSRNGLLSGIEFTEIQGRLMALLEDGEVHGAKTLRAVIDSEATNKNLNQHVNRIRELIKSRGLGIVCVYNNRSIHYRLVRLISMSDD